MKKLIYLIFISIILISCERIKTNQTNDPLIFTAKDMSNMWMDKNKIDSFQSRAAFYRGKSDQAFRDKNKKEAKKLLDSSMYFLHIVDSLNKRK